MTAAILISGYLRSYDNLIDFIEYEVKPLFNNLDVFIHITKNESKEDKYLNLIDEDSDIKKIITVLNPKTILIEPNEIYSNKLNINSTINQWAKLYRLNEIKKTYEIFNNKKYDIVIRLRPDLNIKTKNLLDIKISDDTIYIPEDSKIDKSKLYKKTDDYVCDAISFGSSESMDKYFSIYENIKELIEIYGYVSETILYHHLKNSKIKYNKINIDYSFILSKCNVFAICGDSGSGKSTLSEILKNYFTDSFTLECDRYHKWSRGDQNWSNITHLNPDANYIEKMKEDVFNLKIGKEIFQVDYDHKTGKFTEKQNIKPSNNLIVCGLHTIYDDKINSVYDLKIFMDPQKELKHKWKINRDVNERGYDVNKVIESIKLREFDYEKYILPQKENADIIINFFSKENINIFDGVNNELSLRIIIKNKFNIDKIKKLLIKNNIEFSYNNVDKGVEFIFKTYIPLPHPLNRMGNFYDYITYFIFNI
jgi:uridine kinase